MPVLSKTEQIIAGVNATLTELSPGDRVEGLGDFGVPTGEFGTVRQVNDDDAVVKWDDDGSKRLHQPSRGSGPTVDSRGVPRSPTFFSNCRQGLSSKAPPAYRGAAIPGVQTI